MKRIGIAAMLVLALGCGASAGKNEADQELRLARLAADRGSLEEAAQHVENSIALDDTSVARALRAKLIAIGQWEAGQSGAALDTIMDELNARPGSRELLELGIAYVKSSIEASERMLTKDDVKNDENSSEFLRQYIKTAKKDHWAMTKRLAEVKD